MSINFHILYPILIIHQCYTEGLVNKDINSTLTLRIGYKLI